MGSPHLVECIVSLHHASSQLKMWHWQARRHGHHTALDFLVTNLRELVDRLAETTSGYILTNQLQVLSRGARIELSSPVSMSYVNLDAQSDRRAIAQTQQFLVDLVATVEQANQRFCVGASESSISSILDDIVATLHQGIYLVDLR